MLINDGDPLFPKRRIVDMKDISEVRRLANKIFNEKSDFLREANLWQKNIRAISRL